MIRIDRYLSELSESLAKSLTKKVRLSVVVEDAATIESNKATAIGLVMIELITNSIKHAFPQEQRGSIIATYRTRGSDWSLAVSDDGVGISNSSMNVSHSGYGTKIVNALADELDARVIIQSSPKGTRVSLIHAAERSTGDRGAVH
jgi:chemotaxis protein methyltransferase CheR